GRWIFLRQSGFARGGNGPASRSRRIPLREGRGAVSPLAVDRHCRTTPLGTLQRRDHARTHHAILCPPGNQVVAGRAHIRSRHPRYPPPQCPPRPPNDGRLHFGICGHSTLGLSAPDFLGDPSSNPHCRAYPLVSKKCRCPHFAGFPLALPFVFIAFLQGTQTAKTPGDSVRSNAPHLLLLATALVATPAPCSERFVESDLPALAYGPSCSSTVRLQNLSDTPAVIEIEAHRASGALVALTGQASRVIHLDVGQQGAYQLAIDEETTAAWIKIRERVPDSQPAPAVALSGVTECHDASQLRVAGREVAFPTRDPWY